jgi:hypothetical protein
VLGLQDAIASLDLDDVIVWAAAPLVVAGQKGSRSSSCPSLPRSQPEVQGVGPRRPWRLLMTTENRKSPLLSPQQAKSAFKLGGIKVLQDAFLVQAKTKDGNPILMTIGPNGVSALEVVDAEDAGTRQGS